MAVESGAQGLLPFTTLHDVFAPYERSTMGFKVDGMPASLAA